MSILPQISGLALIKILKRDGWQEVSQRGSHVKLVKIAPGTSLKKIVIVPMHKTLKKGTLTAIIKDAGLTIQEFIVLR